MSVSSFDSYDHFKYAFEPSYSHVTTIDTYADIEALEERIKGKNSLHFRDVAMNERDTRILMQHLMTPHGKKRILLRHVNLYPGDDKSIIHFFQHNKYVTHFSSFNVTIRNELLLSQLVCMFNGPSLKRLSSCLNHENLTILLKQNSRLRILYTTNERIWDFDDPALRSQFSNHRYILEMHCDYKYLPHYDNIERRKRALQTSLTVLLVKASRKSVFFNFLPVAIVKVISLLTFHAVSSMSEPRRN